MGSGERTRAPDPDTSRSCATYRSDDPLAAADPLNYMHPGYDVTNFHRIVVHGSTLPLEWLRLTVDPRANAVGPFS